ncbi:Hypothetical protein SMAX5B_016367 [Scophthalmus maximus]|uniref:Uncharacterized protein n=1 Tax=Scophthalmus maximus TaxID=52904 RepID=A0A2U9C112_SCOMX|nr:Hypothetical protein SMAX5B_016367 [Scophthalmus maximus]
MDGSPAVGRRRGPAGHGNRLLRPGQHSAVRSDSARRDRPCTFEQLQDSRVRRSQTFQPMHCDEDGRKEIVYNSIPPVGPLGSSSCCRFCLTQTLGIMCRL